MRTWVAMAAVLAAATAHAQSVEVPILVMESESADADAELGGDTELNLANLVQTAAKGVTTVQEAPAIITVIPGDEIADRSTRNLEDVLDRVPGWMRYGGEYSQFASANPRGVFQATLLLRDGVSMFDSMVNIATVSRMQPLETIKRLEIVTGPGGVLWGANSFLGVINIITKDAEDIDGVEMSVGGGSGEGDRDVLRGYVMVGAPRLLGGKAKLFAHASFETYKGPIYTMPNHLFGSPTPQPNGLTLYGPITSSDPMQSMIFNFDGKLTLGDGAVNLYWSLPWAERNHSIGFPGGIVREDLAEDNLPGCSPIDPNDPLAGSGADECIDRGRVYRRNRINFYERYGIAEYKTRFRDDKAGLTVKGYFIQLVRNFNPLTVLNPIPQLLEGGLSFAANLNSYRAGAVLDGDLELARNVRLIYGAEGFHEWLPDTTRKSRQGSGAEATFVGPYNLNLLPLPCPRTATWNGSDAVDAAFVEDCPVTFAFSANRTVFGAFAAVQWRVTDKLILDAGVRGQVAPSALSKRGYDPTPIGSAAIVYEFIKDWHAKLNFAQGFRTPVFNNTDSNAQAVQILGDPDLQIERSTAFQGEVNARLLKGRRRIRELDLRADYSYTRLDNVIIVNNGRYTNGAARGVQSAEVLAKLYLKGDHRIELGYTWLRTTTRDKGAYRSNPEHWFNVGGVVTLIPRTLELNATLRVIGAFEDPNLRVEARGLMYDPRTGAASFSVPGQIVAVEPTENVLDRIPPAGELEIGIRYHGWKDRLTISATAYNALDVQHYQPDAFMDYEPRNEYLPNPYERFRFFATASVAY